MDLLAETDPQVMRRRELGRLRDAARRQEREGAITNDLRLPTGGIPPPGIAYSPNFSRFGRMGAFATQNRD